MFRFKHLFKEPNFIFLLFNIHIHFTNDFKPLTYLQTGASIKWKTHGRLMQNKTFPKTGKCHNSLFEEGKYGTTFPLGN